MAPLSFQTVPIHLRQGRDGKRDKKLAIPGRLTVLDNGEFADADTISKREGFAALTNNGDAFPSASGLAVLGDELVAVPSDYRDGLVAYGSGKSRGVNRGVLPQVTTELQQVIRGTSDQSGFDFATTANVTLYAWEDSRGGVRISVVDEASGTHYVSDFEVSSTGKIPRVLANNGKLALLYAEGTNILLRRFDPADPETVPSATTVRTDSQAGSSARFDVALYGTDMAIAYRETGGDLRIVRVLHDGTAAFGPVTAVASAPSFVAVNVLGGYILALVDRGASGVYCYAYAGDLTATGNVQVDATATSGCAIASIVDPDDATKLRVVYHVAAASKVNYIVRQAILVAPSGVPAVSTAAATLVRSVALGSCPFLFEGAPTIIVLHESTYQSTAFAVPLSGEVSGKVIARALTWRSAGHATKARLPSGIAVSGGASVLVGEKGRIQFEQGKDATNKGLSRLTLYNTDSGWRSWVRYNGVLYFAGAAPHIYDGKQVAEEGFHLFPEGFTLSADTSGSLSDGTYQVTFVYEWVDGAGRRWQSIAGVPKSVTLSAGTGTQSIDTVCPTLRLTRKTRVVVVPYVTEAGGTVFYRAQSLSSATANSTSTDTVSIMVASVDTTAEVLYTTGGILDNEPCPPCRGFVVHQDRLWAVGLEDPHRFAYSQESREGDAAGFSEVFTGSVPPDFGWLSGAAPMDDKLILFTEERPFYIAGEGPLRTGQQNGYTLPQMVMADAGCKLGGHRAIAREPDGLWFHSAKGLRLLTRSLELGRRPDGAWMGSEVDDYASAIEAGLLHPSKPQAWFFTGSAVLVWDFLWQQWSRFTGYTAADGAVWDGSVIHATGTSVFRSGGGVWTDNGTAYFLVIETGWLSFAGVMGFQRVRRALVLGDFGSEVSIRLQAGYDFDDSWNVGVTANTTDLGSSSVAVQLRHHLAIQKCRSIRFRVSEEDAGGGVTAGAGFSLSNLSLEVGLKKGSAKLPAAKTI